MFVFLYFSVCVCLCTISSNWWPLSDTMLTMEKKKKSNEYVICQEIEHVSLTMCVFVFVCVRECVCMSGLVLRQLAWTSMTFVFSHLSDFRAAILPSCQFSKIVIQRQFTAFFLDTHNFGLCVREKKERHNNYMCTCLVFSSFRAMSTLPWRTAPRVAISSIFVRVAVSDSCFTVRHSHKTLLMHLISRHTDKHALRHSTAIFTNAADMLCEQLSWPRSSSPSVRASTCCSMLIQKLSYLSLPS